MWQHIVSDSALISLISEQSFSKFILVFKHSTRCPVSFTAKKLFEFNWALTEVCDTYLLDLIAYRNISNLISEELNVQHESPQILLIKDGICIYHKSHGAINADEVKKLIPDK